MASSPHRSLGPWTGYITTKTGKICKAMTWSVGIYGHLDDVSQALSSV